tara:strand:+ start:7631 stop:8977 length:1347 start_codon:yes stop_codon:yes gene_type:complete
MKKQGEIFIVHHVDTEGPLTESLDQTFNRLNEIIGYKLDLEPTLENLQLLQSGKISFDKKIEETIKKILNPKLLSFKNSWNEINAMLDRITTMKFRKSLKDSYGNGWIYNWHIMDHVGFKSNKRCRDLGYLKIFNHYEDYFKKNESYKDSFQWHFHPIGFNKHAHKYATSYENSYYEIHQILCRRLIEKNWFPQVNRAGFHTIRPDSNWFLEQWIPFDPSNQATIQNKNSRNQSDNKFGRFGDWTNAPNNWDIYNPDLYDWRKEGNLKRFVAKTLNLNTRFRNINFDEIQLAFDRATQGKNVYLGVTNHDFREMSHEIEDFYNLFKDVAKRYPHIKFQNSETISAFRDVIGFDLNTIEKNKIDFNISIQDNVLKVKIINGEPFGSQPYMAIKTKNGEYFHDNLDFGSFKKEYFYTFDSHTINTDEVKKIAIASNDKFGNCNIETIDFN